MRKNPETVSLETANAQLVLARRGDVWTWAHLGASGCDPADCAALAALRPPRHHHCPTGSMETYPAFGSERGQCAAALGNARGALQVRHADGDCATQWTSVAASAGDGRSATVTCTDRKHPAFRAVQHFVAHPDCDVFETWVELRHEEEGPVEISRMASFCLESAGLGERFHLLTLSGLWAAEANVVEDELPRGREAVIGARSGIHDAWENAQGFMLCAGDAPATEEAGRVLAGALCWSGAWEMRIRHEWSHELLLSAGVANLSGPYRLEPGRTLALPKFVFTWSERGKGAASRALHRWARSHLMPHGAAPRPVVFNSWEGVRFDISEKRLVKMMDGAAALGAECFVIDDGWFGRGAFARNDAAHGLGDWVPDPAKFPRGLAPLAAEAKKRGMTLGLWFEPEMATLESELVRDHPGWVLRGPDWPPRLQRGGGQVVLDFSRREVRDHIFCRIGAVIRSIPGLAYVKLDANVEIADFGSNPNLWFDHAAGYCEFLARLRAAHPRIVFQSCASGGGRADFGALAFADEFWASDNTGAQQRAMIQYGWSHFFPACAVAAHVTASPNKHIRRAASLKYRFDVAFCGRLGIELKPDGLTPEELAYARRRVAEYKRLRPVIQGGDLYRLHAPREGGYAALACVAPDRRRAVVAVIGLSRPASDGRLAPLRLPCLDPALRYRIRELGADGGAERSVRQTAPARCSGATLAHAGLPFDLGPGDDSFVLELAAQPRATSPAST